MNRNPHFISATSEICLIEFHAISCNVKMNLCGLKTNIHFILETSNSASAGESGAIRYRFHAKTWISDTTGRECYRKNQVKAGWKPDKYSIPEYRITCKIILILHINLYRIITQMSWTAVKNTDRFLLQFSIQLVNFKANKPRIIKNWFT